MSAWCRRCGEPVKLSGGAWLFPSLAKATHQATGLENCADGEHLAAPTDEDPALRRLADEIEVEFGGVFVISAHWGFFRADWRTELLEPAAVAAHYEAETADDLRARLRRALAPPGAAVLP